MSFFHFLCWIQTFLKVSDYTDISSVDLSKLVMQTQEQYTNMGFFLDFIICRNIYYRIIVSIFLKIVRGRIRIVKIDFNYVISCNRCCTKCLHVIWSMNFLRYRNVNIIFVWIFWEIYIFSLACLRSNCRLYYTCPFWRTFIERLLY